MKYPHNKPFIMLGEPRVPIGRDGYEVHIRLCFMGEELDESGVIVGVRKTLFGGLVFYPESTSTEQIQELMKINVDSFRKTLCDQIMNAEVFPKS